MKIFFDEEFTGLHKDTTLISIGLISSDGRSFYAEFNDYDIKQCNEWINKKVLPNLSKTIDELSSIADINVDGDINEIRTELIKWIDQFDTVEWVSDVCHYDMVLLIDLLYQDGIDLPYDRVSSVCHDINQDIAKFYNVSDMDAFNISREQIIIDLYGNPIEGCKHNSFYDAKVIKAIYEFITGV